MASRHEEKYIINYKQYAMIKSRIQGVLTPDIHGDHGTYLITSLYYDDHLDSARAEKRDGLPEHSKFRIRTYGCGDTVIHLERKDKNGILTHKLSANLTKDQVYGMLDGQFDLSDFSGNAYDLVAQMESRQLIPTIAVRYLRDAYVYPGTDLRLTFDTNLEAITPDPQALFSASFSGVPVLDHNSIIMEIKYGSHLPAFLRKLTNVSCQQLSVSKYALCRERII